MPSPFMLKIIGGLGALLLLAGLFADRGRWMRRAHNAEAQVTAICQAARDASNNPKLDCKQTAQQVRFLGEAINALHGAIEKQNAAVDALGAKSKADQAAAAEASRNAQARARGAESTVERLKASAKAGGASTGVCEPSKTVKEIWR